MNSDHSGTEGRGPMATEAERQPRFLDYCCPRCKGELQSEEGSYHCPACSSSYPVVLGIPDFRISPDPYISIEDDHAKGRRIQEQAASKSFKELVEYYWSITPDTPEALAKRFVRHAMVGADRGRRFLAALEPELPTGEDGPPMRILELGCRTGGTLVAAGERYQEVIGIDIAFRWLVVSRVRMEEAGLPCQLVCCCAEALPFRDGAVGVVLAENVIEHTREQEKMLHESARVLAPGGTLGGMTCNRFSLAPEPHVRVWGVGWLPRRWADPYVRFIRGIPYEHVRLLSRREMKRMLREASFPRARFLLPTIGESEQEGLGSWERRLIRIYHRLIGWPLFDKLLLAVGPVFQFACRKSGGGNGLSSGSGTDRDETDSHESAG